MTNSNYKKWDAVAVAILKNEAPYVENWLLHHISIGFQHFFIYDNDSSDALYKNVKKFIAGGLVTLINWPLSAGQIDAYNHALTLLQARTEWLAFFDIDEYVVLHSHESLEAYLGHFDADQILLPWRNFPYGGHRAMPGGTDAENYFWAYKAGPKSQVQVKHFVRSRVAESVTAHFSFISSEKTILADGTKYRPTHVIEGPSYRLAQINHYATRSFNENAVRLQKGRVSGGEGKKAADFFPLTAQNLDNLEYDDSILKHFDKFSAIRNQWTKAPDRPHRFGLMQSKAVLSSWNNVSYFFCKSYANYLMSLGEIEPVTNLDLIRIELSGKETHIRSFWTDSAVKSIHFRVDGRGFLPYFMGSIHYGDFIRRFGFEANFIRRNMKLDEQSMFASDFGKGCFAAIFEVISDEGLEIEMTAGGRPVAGAKIFSGRHAGLIYNPAYFSENVPISLRFSARCHVHELIVGSLP